MTPDEAREVIAKERQILGYWELQRRGQNLPDQTVITLAELNESIKALLDAANYVPQSEAEDVTHLVELTHTRIKLKNEMKG